MKSTNEQRENRGGRVQRHGAGVGVITPELVEERAREIARIAGRQPGGITEDDRGQALRELQDETLHLSTDEARSDRLASRNPAHLGVETGHKVEDIKPPDTEPIVEKEVEEGVREAEHEHMLEGRARSEEKEKGA
jgi:hypothetical protein